MNEPEISKTVKTEVFQPIDHDYYIVQAWVYVLVNGECLRFDQRSYLTGVDYGRIDNPSTVLDILKTNVTMLLFEQLRFHERLDNVIEPYHANVRQES